MYPRRAIVAAALACLGVSGCGPQGPVQFGSLEMSGGRVDMPETRPGQLVPVEEWPDACQLLTEDEVKSLLPQAGIDSRSVQVEVIGLGAGAQEGLAPAGQCDFELSLPGTDSSHHAQIWVNVQAVGDPSRIELSLDGSGGDEDEGDQGLKREDHGSSLGPQQCLTLGEPDESLTPTLRCRQGPLEFDVRGAAGAQTDIPGAANNPARNRIFYSKVIMPSVEAVAAKVPAS